MEMGGADSRASERPGAGEESLEAELSSAPRNSRCFGLRWWLGAAVPAVVGFREGLLQPWARPHLGSGTVVESGRKTGTCLQFSQKPLRSHNPFRSFHSYYPSIPVTQTSASADRSAVV